MGNFGNMENLHNLIDAGTSDTILITFTQSPYRIGRHGLGALEIALFSYWEWLHVGEKV